MKSSETKAGSVNYLWLAIGLLVSLSLGIFTDLEPGNPQVTYTAAVALLMAIWWVSEALPMGITSLLPVILFPLLGILDGGTTSSAYFNYIIFLYVGGFIMALAMEKFGLHRRIALKILSVMGGSPLRILMGFIIASSFLSMWISNTATAMMMLPIAFSVIGSLEEVYGGNSVSKFGIGLLLAMAYACSIGGISTPVGTPPNLSFMRIFQIMYPEAPTVAFGEWLLFAFPITLIMLIAALFVIYYRYRPGRSLKSLPPGFFRQEYKKLGAMSREERIILVLFLVLVTAWVFRKPLAIGSFQIPGWSSLFNTPEYINDGTVAIAVAFLLFIIPASNGKALMGKNVFIKIPWNIVFLFGGGFALAHGFVDSGLSTFIGRQLAFAGNLSEFQLIGISTFSMSLLTEFTSNAATTEMMLPIASGLASEINVHPLLLMVPVTLAGSMAFMFPIATPPNAIVFSSEKIHMKDMFLTGITLNMVAVIIITIFMLVWGKVVFEIGSVLPSWAAVHP